MKGKISVSRISYSNRNSVGIEIKDDNSRIKFLDIEMSCENFGKLLSGMSYIECDFEIKDINKVGMKKIVEEMIFEMPDYYEYENRKFIAYNIVKNGIEVKNQGWEINDSLNSKDSFYEEDGIEYCKMRIAKWVDIDDK